MSTRVLIKAQTNGIQVDMLKYPALYTPPSLRQPVSVFKHGSSIL